MTRLYTDHVELYDIAFDWDVTGEVDWLLERLGPACRSVLEPGCGTGRMLEALGRRGVEAVGLDSSEATVLFAQKRLERAGVAATVHVADMASFELGRLFDGAICPINTLGHLRPDELARHLDCMARQLRAGGRYLVQVGIVEPGANLQGSDWVAERDGIAVRIRWEPVRRDAARAREEHHSRIEVLEGPRKGEVIEETHVMTMWTPATWRAALAASAFRLAATYDGSLPGRPRAELDDGGGLLWHELVLG